MGHWKINADSAKNKYMAVERQRTELMKRLEPSHSVTELNKEAVPLYVRGEPQARKNRGRPGAREEGTEDITYSLEKG